MKQLLILTFLGIGLYCFYLNQLHLLYSFHYTLQVTTVVTFDLAVEHW